MIPTQPVETIGTYAGGNPQYITEPVGEDFTNGVEPLDTLPAGWWNWLWNKITLNEGRTVTVLNSLVSECLTVLGEAGITADNTQTNQLKNAIKLIIQSSTGVISNLTTTDKANLVAAINELNAALGLVSSLETDVKTNVVAAINSIVEAVGAAGGIASLDGDGRIPYSQLPESAVEFKGTWNAATNTPTLTNGVGTNGDFYIVSVEGIWQDEQYYVGDRIIYSGDTNTWDRLGGGNVTSVNGKTGAVELAATDVGAVPSTAAEGAYLAAYVRNGKNNTMLGISNGASNNSLVQRTTTGQVKGADIEPTDTDTTILANKKYVDHTERFTYIVNSDESLAYWLSNKASGESSGGDDFTSVLIKAGEWSYDGSISYLNTVGTKAIEGEVGNKVNLTAALCYSVPYDYKTPEHYIKGLNLFCVRNSTGAPLYPIYHCANLTDVTITFEGTLANGYGIYECENLINCNVVVGKNSSVGNAACYYGCKNLTNCNGEASASSVTIYRSCNDLVNCSVTYSRGSTVTYFLGCNNIANIHFYFRGVSDTFPVCFFESCRRLANCYVEFTLSTSLGGIATQIYGFYKCDQLSNCYAKIGLNNYAATGDHRSVGCCYKSCTYLNSCEGYITSYVAGPEMINVYANCDGVHNCTGTHTLQEGHTSGANDTVVYECTGVIGCSANVSNAKASSTSFGSYLRSWSVYNKGTSSSDTFLCARTANGGFNS